MPIAARISFPPPPQTIQTPQLKQGAAQPRDAVEALRDDIEKVGNGAVFPEDLLSRFHTIHRDCNAAKKTPLLLAIIALLTARGKVPAATLADVEGFREIGELLPIEDKKEIRDDIAGQYAASGIAPPALKWLSVFAQMIRTSSPLRDPIALRMTLPTDEQLLADEDMQSGHWKSLMQLQVQPLLNKLAPAVDAKNLDRELLNAFYTMGKLSGERDLQFELAMELIQAISASHSASLTYPGKMDAEEMKAMMAEDLLPAQIQAFKDHIQKHFPVATMSRKYSRWAGVYYQMLSNRKTPVLPINTNTLGHLSEQEGHPFSDAFNQKKSSVKPCTDRSSTASSRFSNRATDITPSQNVLDAGRPAHVVPALPRPVSSVSLSPFSSTSPLTPLFERLDYATKENLITRGLLKCFYIATRNASPDQKTLLICKFMEIGSPREIAPRFSGELGDEYMECCERDAEKFRALATDFDPNQKREVEAKFKEIFLSEIKNPIARLWGGVLGQMFDLQFPILPINLDTLGKIFKTPGRTFYIPPTLKVPRKAVVRAAPTTRQKPHSSLSALSRRKPH